MFFIRWNYLLADLVLISFVTQVFLFNNGGLPIAYLPWLAALSAALLINTLLRRHAAPVNAVICANVVMALAVGMLSLQLVTFPADAFISRILFFILTALPALHSAMLVTEEPLQRQTVLYLDALVVTTAISLLLVNLGTLDEADPLIPLGELSCLGILLSLIVSRLERPQTSASTGRRLTGVLMMAVLFLLLLFLAVLAASHFQGISSGIVGAAVWLGQQLLGVLHFLGRNLGRFFTWLLSLFPVKDEEWILPEPETQAELLEEAAVESNDTMALILLILLGILVAALILFALHRLHGKRWQDAKGAALPPRKTARQSHLRQKLLLLWQRLLAFLHFQLNYLRHRESPAGILVWTERKLRTSGLPRQKSESPSAYLRRLAALSPAYEPSVTAASPRPDICSMPPTVSRPVPLNHDRLTPSGHANAISAPDFFTLANLLEQQFYRRTPGSLPPGFSRQYKKSLRTWSHALPSQTAGNQKNQKKE